MSITEDAEAPARVARRSPVRRPGHARRASPWSMLVVACALILVGVVAVMAVWWAASTDTEIRPLRVTGTLSSVEIDVGAAPVDISGGAGGAVEIRRTEQFAFGRRPRSSVDASGGVLRIVSRCPDTVLGRCAASYRVAVPDNVLVNVRTSSGHVRISGLNGSARVATGSGPIAVDGFCGFTLVATSASGDVSGNAECSPDRIEMRSGSGDVSVVVPVGRYRVDAHNDAGTERVRGLTRADDAAFTVQALSGSGEVSVEGRGA